VLCHPDHVNVRSPPTRDIGDRQSGHLKAAGRHSSNCDRSSTGRLWRHAATCHRRDRSAQRSHDHRVTPVTQLDLEREEARPLPDCCRTLSSPVTGTSRELWASRNKGWLSPDDVAEVNALLARLGEITSQPRGVGRDQLASLAFVLAPLNAKPKRRISRKADQAAGS